MTSSNIFLILVSGLGVLHGVLLAVFLWVYTKGNSTANKILSVLLLVLSFRVGKSVFLEFAQDMDVQFIFVGLSTLMAIGPLYYFYSKAVVAVDFKFKPMNLVHFIPTLSAFLYPYLICVN